MQIDQLVVCTCITQSWVNYENSFEKSRSKSHVGSLAANCHFWLRLNPTPTNGERLMKEKTSFTANFSFCNYSHSKLFKPLPTQAIYQTNRFLLQKQMHRILSQKPNFLHKKLFWIFFSFINSYLGHFSVGLILVYTIDIQQWISWSLAPQKQDFLLRKGMLGSCHSVTTSRMAVKPSFLNTMLKKSYTKSNSYLKENPSLPNFILQIIIQARNKMRENDHFLYKFCYM